MTLLFWVTIKIKNRDFSSVYQFGEVKIILKNDLPNTPVTFNLLSKTDLNIKDLNKYSTRNCTQKLKKNNDILNVKPTHYLFNS